MPDVSNVKKVLYLRVEVDAPEDWSPLDSMPDAALWAETRLTRDAVSVDVTAYANIQDFIADNTTAG